MSTIDTILYKEIFSVAPESVNVLDNYFQAIGGKGLIAAMALQYCSVSPTLISMVAPHSEIFQACAERISTAALIPVLTRDHRTWITVDGSQRSVTHVGLGEIQQGSPASHRNENVAAAIDGSDIVYLSTEDQWLIGPALTYLAQAGLPLITNLCLPLLQTLGNPRAIQQVIARSTVLLMNQAESHYALKVLGVDSWRSVKSPTLREIVVTCGSDGGTYSQYPFGSWSSYEAAAVRPLKVRCTVGAGDTFNGAYVARRFGGGYSIRESCLAAAELAALKVTQEGTSLLW